MFVTKGDSTADSHLRPFQQRQWYDGMSNRRVRLLFQIDKSTDIVLYYHTQKESDLHLPTRDIDHRVIEPLPPLSLNDKEDHRYASMSDSSTPSHNHPFLLNKEPPWPCHNQKAQLLNYRHVRW